MFQRLSARLAPSDPDTRDAGLSLVETVIALMVFAIITTGAIMSIGLTLSLSSDNRSRQVAANLASQAIDTARAAAQIDSVTSGETTTVVNGTTFTVAQSAAWLTTTGVEATCSPVNAANNGALFYKRLNVSVTWDGMRASTSAVRADTLLAPNGKINDPSTGSILIQVTGASGAGVAGVAITVEPDTKSSAPGKALKVDSMPAATNADGCSVAIKVQPGAYKVSISKSGSPVYVDPQHDPSPSKTGVVVAAGDSTGAAFSYAPADDYAVKYNSTYTGTALIPRDLATTIIGSNGSYTATTPASDQFLYPLTSGYRFYAGAYAPAGSDGGSCLSPDPASWPAAGDGRTGKAQQSVRADAPVGVPMGVVTVNLTSGNQTFISATTSTISASLNGDPGCAKTMTYTYQLSSNASRATIALPYGTWAISSARDSSSGLTKVSSITPPPGAFTGAIIAGTGASSNIVTLDPRTAP
ncbi:hypothetical protein ACPEEZ_02015 [Frigoribacterium sp. 2-23]|uniref:hypothetical protein n=1 Tax=Frigoribacterium sp. 2-23 TaxID=3415006 RepID=UPI003C6F031A